MAKKNLKIVHISSEVSPFSKTGGLADVVRSLPKSQNRLGHNVIIITPLYEQIISKKKHDLKLVYKNVKVYLNSEETVTVDYWMGYLMEKLPVYFVSCKRYFSKRKNLYGSDHENARFLVFDVAALKLISLLKFEADIVHCHDWQTGLIPFYLKTDFRYSKTLKKAKTIFTIHNLVFQLGSDWWKVPLENKDYGHKRIPHISDPAIENINFAKRAILKADIINTVSEQYREEIMTRKFGQDLNRILKNRKNILHGIVNGIDYKSYDPARDLGLFKNFDYRKVHRKKLNKEYLQKKVGLAVNCNTPLFCATSRVTFQKGFELVIPLLDSLLKKDLQIIILGDGEKKYIQTLKKFQKRFNQKLIWLPFKGKNGPENNLETLIYAASDFLLLPSHHEPCGINQLKAMRYGCIPIVRKVGGLHDTVENFSPNGQGTGFVFEEFDCLSLQEAIINALNIYKNKRVWRELVSRDMQKSSSWEIPAKKYIDLYKTALGGNK